MGVALWEREAMAVQDIDERTRLQFEYAWRWFDYHAKQRMTMFYYYLVMVGILTSAWALASDKKQVAVAGAIGVLGLVTSIAAICFDMRNRQMCTAAEDILEKLETDAIYRTDLEGENRNLIGPLSSDRLLGMREDQRRSWKKAVLKHKFWIRSLEGLFAIGFGLGIILATVHAKERPEDSTLGSFGISIADTVEYPFTTDERCVEDTNGN